MFNYSTDYAIDMAYKSGRDAGIMSMLDMLPADHETAAMRLDEDIREYDAFNASIRPMEEDVPL